MKSTLFGATMAMIAAVALTSCSSSNNNQKQDMMSKQNVEENVREFVYPLPTAFEVTEMLNRIEAAYISVICNEQSAYDKYLTEDKRALNLGIYSADLCYASTYNQQQNVKEYMDVISKLIDALDITKAIDPELPSKIENNENNKDELTSLISESFYDLYDYLNRNDRGPVSLLVVTGSWVEGLFITTHISENTFENKEMVKILLSQKDPLIKLMELLNNYKGNANIDSVIEQLTPLYTTYTSIDDSGITEAQTEDIRNAVDAVRSEIVKY